MRKMKLQHLLLYLCAVLVLVTVQAEEKQAVVLDPRGPRPAEPGTKADKCANQKEWPICMDEDWGRKCPSGCRIQGLLDQTDLEILSKIDKIRKLLDDGKKMHRSADQASKDTYNYLRDRLVSSSDNDNRYATVAEQLRQRIVEMKIKIDRQLRMLEALKSQVKNQVIAMQRLEVDIDIKLRSCKGSCASYAAFSLDKDSYAALDKQLGRLDELRVQSVETVSSLKVMKSRPMKDVTLPTIYKSGPTGTFFENLAQTQLSLEAEGSTAESAATVVKVNSVCKSIQSQKQHTPYVFQQRFGQCPRSKYPKCTQDEEELKCPSGCRVQGFIDKAEEDILRHVHNICQKSLQLKTESSTIIVKGAQLYETQRRISIKTYMEEKRYVEIVEQLHRNFTWLLKKSKDLSRELQQKHSQIKDQFNKVIKTEVDIDIKLRACKGSCKQTFDHAIDHKAIKTIVDEMSSFNLDYTSKNTVTLDKKINLQTAHPMTLAYRNIPIVQLELFTKFEDIEQNQIVLQEVFSESTDES